MQVEQIVSVYVEHYGTIYGISAPQIGVWDVSKDSWGGGAHRKSEKWPDLHASFGSGMKLMFCMFTGRQTGSDSAGRAG